MGDPNPIDSSLKALIREVPHAIVRLAGIDPPPDLLLFDDTAINLAERRADHVLILGAPEDPDRAALYLEYQLRPDPARIPEWEFKRSALRLRLEMPVVLLVIYLEQGDRSTFPGELTEAVRGIANEFRFTTLRLWEHAARIRSGELWELAPLLVLCDNNPGGNLSHGTGAHYALSGERSDQGRPPRNGAAHRGARPPPGNAGVDHQGDPTNGPRRKHHR